MSVCSSVFIILALNTIRCVYLMFALSALTLGDISVYITYINGFSYHLLCVRCVLLLVIDTWWRNVILNNIYLYKTQHTWCWILQRFVMDHTSLSGPYMKVSRCFQQESWCQSERCCCLLEINTNCIQTHKLRKRLTQSNLQHHPEPIPADTGREVGERWLWQSLLLKLMAYSPKSSFF